MVIFPSLGIVSNIILNMVKGRFISDDMIIKPRLPAEIMMFFFRAHRVTDDLYA